MDRIKRSVFLTIRGEVYANELTRQEFQSLPVEQQNQAETEAQTFYQEQKIARMLSESTEWEQEVSHMIVYKGKEIQKLPLDRIDPKTGEMKPISYLPNKRVSGLRVERMMA